MLSKLFIRHLRNIENNIYPLFPLSYSNSFLKNWLFFFYKTIITWCKHLCLCSSCSQQLTYDDLGVIMGNKEEKWTQCVTLTVLLMMVMTVEGTDPVCRPFCHLPPETHEKCSSLRFLFSCISKVKMRYNSEKVSLNYIYFIKVGLKKKKFKTKLNCGNAVTNVKHLTHVNYIPQIYVFKTVLVYHFVHLQDVQ